MQASVAMAPPTERGSLSYIVSEEREMEETHSESSRSLSSFLKSAMNWIQSQPEIAVGLWFGWYVSFVVCLVLVICRDCILSSFTNIYYLEIFH